MRQKLQISLTILVTVIGALFFYFNRSEIRIILEVGVSDVVKLFALTFLFFYVTGFTFSRLVHLLDVNLTQVEIIGLSIITNFGNYLGPIRPGAAMKAVYLKSSKGLNYSHFLSILAANSFLAMLMTGSTGLVLLYFLQRNMDIVQHSLILICIALILFSIAPFLFNFPEFDGKNRFTDIIHRASKGFQIIREKKKELVIICLTFQVQFFLSAFINMVAFNAIGMQISFLAAIIIGVFASIANFFTFTPNNLGIQETVIALLLSITGFDFTTGVIGASLSRIIHILITFSLSPIFIHLLLKNQKQNSNP